MTSASSRAPSASSVVAFVHHEAARDHLGHALERAGLLVDGDDRHDQAVFSQVAAIAQHFVADLAGPRAVDQHAADGRLAGDARALGVELQDVAVLGQQHLRLRLAPGEHALGDARVLRQLPELAVNRHEIARPDERQHQLQLLLAAVARDVNVLDALVNHVGAAPRDVVDHAPDGDSRCPEWRAPTAPRCRPGPIFT